MAGHHLHPLRPAHASGSGSRTPDSGPRLPGFHFTRSEVDLAAAAASSHADMRDRHHHHHRPAAASPSVLQRPTNSATGLDSKLQRTPSQNSVSSLSALHTGAQTPQPSRRGAAAAMAALNQTGQVRCLQTLSQTLADEQTRERGEDRHSDGGDGARSSCSALALALNADHVFSGSQRGHIYVWSRESFRLEHVLYGHTAGCLALVLDDAHGILFSGGGDGKVRAWDVRTLRCLYVVHAGVNSGAILSLAYSRTRDVLVLGCQNTSIQVFDVANKDAVRREERISELAARRSRFFDSATAAAEACAPSMSQSGRSVSPADSAAEPAEVDQYVIRDQSVMHFAHSGYVYTLLLGSSGGDEELLFSAASDGAIKLWRLSSAGIEEARLLDRGAAADGDGVGDDDVCIHSLALDDGLLFAGLQSGEVEVWDIETMQLIRTLDGGGTANVLSLLVHDHRLYAGAADGTIHVWGADLLPLGCIAGGSDSVLALVAASDDDLVVSGTGDGDVAFWDVSALMASAGDPTAAGVGAALLGLRVSPKDDNAEKSPATGRDAPHRRLRGRHMLHALEQWIQYKSVSGVPELQSECRRAARFLKDLMRQRGAADARLISSTPSGNPLVYGRFDASDAAANALPLAERPTIFVYGHYDVMPAGDEALWRSPPFEMVGRDGYLYGRGVSDDKGPVLATLFAISELAASGDLPMTVVFCIEGEEESGSHGLHETMEAHRELFGVPRLILLSLSYWLGESTPCLTYGMRGSIRANMRVESTRNADVHAGVWGGAVSEPLTCLSHILARLADPSGRVLVPGFHDSVRPVSEKESAAMHDLVHWITDKEARAPLVTRTVLSPAASDKAQADLYSQLMQRWRFPTLTVHHMDVSTAAARTNTTLVPAAAEASLSVRVVPDQSLEDIADKLRSYIEDVFSEIQTQRQQGASTNGRALLDDLRLHLEVTPNAQWWLADPETPVYQAAANAIREEWAGEGEAAAPHVPLLIREGGSIPAVPWLESFFAPHAVAVNLPMGQSSDNAHLDNERISLNNLMRGRRIIERLVKDVANVL